MKTYTISATVPDGLFRVPLNRAKETKDNAMQAARNFSNHATLCDVVLTCGSKHVVTYRNGRITKLNGKEHKA
jgi:hypothetical protein